MFNIPIFIDIYLVKEDIKEYFMCQYSVFYGEYENEKKTGQKNLTFSNGDLNPGFLNKFPPTIWNLREIRSIELTVLKKSRLYLHVCYVNVNKLQMVFVRKKNQDSHIRIRCSISWTQNRITKSGDFISIIFKSLIGVGICAKSTQIPWEVKGDFLRL